MICAKGDEAVTNSGYRNVYFTINGPLKMLPRHFWYFHCSNFKMTFDQKKIEKKQPFFNFFQVSTMSQNFAFWQPLAVK